MPNGTDEFTISTRLGTTDEAIDVTIEHCDDFDGDGIDLNDVRLTFSVSDASFSGTEDITGVAFNFDDAFNDNIEITGGDFNDVDPANIPPGDGSWGFMGFGDAGPFDAAVGYENQGDVSVREVSFVVSTIDDSDFSNFDLLNGEDVYVRVQSTDGGEGSAKTGGTLIASDCDDGEEPPGEGGDGKDISNVVFYTDAPEDSDCDENGDGVYTVKIDDFPDSEEGGFTVDNFDWVDDAISELASLDDCFVAANVIGFAVKSGVDAFAPGDGVFSESTTNDTAFFNIPNDGTPDPIDFPPNELVTGPAIDNDSFTFDDIFI